METFRKHTPVCISIKENTLTLHTGISERDFAQAKLSQFLTQEGYSFTNNTFKTWRFNETAVDNNGITLGTKLEKDCAECEFVPLESLFSEQSLKNQKKLLVVLQAFVEAKKQGIQLPFAGSRGILISENNSVFFLPDTIYKNALLSDSDTTYSLECGMYLNPLLEDEQSTAFTLASLVYRYVTGDFAYKQTNTEKRIVDYIDSMFIPLELFIDNAENLAQIINSALSKSDKITQIGDILLAFENNKIIKPDNTVAMLLERKRLEFIKNQTKKIEWLRFFQKNKQKLTIIAVGVLCFSLLIYSFIQKQSERPTTEGLTYLETINLFYDAYNKLDIENMSAAVSRNAAKDYIDFATNIYVSAKMRQAFEQGITFVTPQEWLSFSSEEKEGCQIFGIYDLRINEIDSQVTNDTTKKFLVTYYYVMTLEETIVFEREDTLTLTLDDSWKISAVETIQDSSENEILQMFTTE